MTEKQRAEFEALTRPLMQWLNTNGHPHMSILVTTDRAEVSEGVCAFATDEYVLD